MAQVTAVRAFVYFSVFAALLHFVGETWVHMLYGQFLPMLIVDYIAIGLILLGAAGFLKFGWGPGLLCGGWGFTFCLNYRAFFWRVEAMMNQTANEVVENTAFILAIALLFSSIAFLLSVVICVKHERV